MSSDVVSRTLKVHYGYQNLNFHGLFPCESGLANISMSGFFIHFFWNRSFWGISDTGILKVFLQAK